MCLTNLEQLQRWDSTLQKAFEKVICIDDVQTRVQAILSGEAYIIRRGLLYPHPGEGKAEQLVGESLPGFIGQGCKKMCWPIVKSCPECQLTSKQKTSLKLLQPLLVIDVPFTCTAFWSSAIMPHAIQKHSRRVIAGLIVQALLQLFSTTRDPAESPYKPGNGLPAKDYGTGLLVHHVLKMRELGEMAELVQMNLEQAQTQQKVWYDKTA